MRKLVVMLVLAILTLGVVGLTTLSQTALLAERAVLFYFDGLHPEAIDRFNLPNLKRLRAEGTWVEDAVMVFPWHPTTGAYGLMHTTSLPNPITMTGNLFLRSDQPMLQDQFTRRDITAIAVGSKAYDTITPGFSLVDLRDTSDAELMDSILATLDRHDPKFFRIQLQDVGRAGMSTINAEDGTPWQADIWHPQAPYAEAARDADRQLGRFITKMKELGRWDDTLFVFMADGQSRYGWHLPMDEESWRTPLIFNGPSVWAGLTIPYAENIDVVPTIAHALGVPTPNPEPGSGRVLTEIFANGPETAPNVPRRLVRFNKQIKEYLLLTAKLRLMSINDPRADNVLMLERNALGSEDPPPFLGIEQIDRWYEAGSIDRLLNRNEAVLQYLRDSLARWVANPLNTDSDTN